jgi:hypothetical protein
MLDAHIQRSLRLQPGICHGLLDLLVKARIHGCTSHWQP